MVSKGVPIKRGAGEGRVDQLVAQLAVPAVGDRQRGELLAMGRQLLREIGEAEDQRAGGRRVDAAAAMARASPPTGGGGGAKRPFLKLPRRSGALARMRGGGPALLVEAVEPVLAVDAGEVGVADRRGVVDQALLEAGPGFGRGQRLGLELVAPQPRVERLGAGEQRFERLAAAGADDVVGVLAGGQLDEAERPVGA